MHSGIFVPYTVDDLISTYISHSVFFGLILLPPAVSLLFGLAMTKYLLHSSIPPIPLLQLYACVESTSNTPGMSIFGIRRLWQRGRHSIPGQRSLEKTNKKKKHGAYRDVSACWCPCERATLSKETRRDFCVPDGALFALLS